MKRSVLTWVTLSLFCLVVGETVRDALTPEPPLQSQASGGAVGAPAPAPTAAPLSDSMAAAPREEANRPAPVQPATPSTTVDRLARLATRRQLAGAADRTYLDSLILTTDSVVRRWPDRRGLLRVAIVEGGVPSYQPRMGEYARRALSVWQEARVGVRFDIVSDTADADVVIRWIDRFPFDRAGQTDLTWDQLGSIRRASISLAVHTNTGVPLPDDALLAVAVHEAGHAIGLPHSADPADVMYPATRTGRLSDRDELTARLLYQLAPGSVRDTTS